MAEQKLNRYASSDQFFGRPKVYTDEFIHNEAIELYKWSQKDDSYILREFAAIRGYIPGAMYEWAEKHKDFSEAFEYARNIIGIRREKREMNKDNDKPYLLYHKWHDIALHKFDRDEKQFDSKLKSNENQASSISQEELHKFTMEWIKKNQDAKIS